MPADAAGLAARRCAMAAVDGVLSHGRPFEVAAFRDLPPRDHAFARALAATTLRRKGELDAVIGRFLAKPLPTSSGETPAVLLTGAAQILFMRVPAHAAIDRAVRLAKAGSNSRHFAGLVNAVLRKVSERGPMLLGGLDAARLNAPPWLWARWVEAYGETTARRIATSHAEEPSLDLSVKPGAIAPPGTVLPTGTLRIDDHGGPIEALPGFAEGSWWVQDAASALPVMLLGDVRGKRVLDLCAAPGGKSAQLAAAGALVTAVDASPARMARLAGNLARLRLEAQMIVSDVLDLELCSSYDAVLLDAPCSATGTIRRHPDLPWLKSEAQIGELAALQQRLLDHAAGCVRPGGLIVYGTCSLEAAEGPERIAAFLSRPRGFSRAAVSPGDIGGQRHLISPEGDLRTLPFMAIGNKRGLDGFFAARLRLAEGR